MAPEFEETTPDFAVSGLYDGLFIMQDDATGSLWNHLTGEAVHGELAGTRMPISNLLQMTVSQALEVSPNTVIAISEQPFHVDGRTGRWMQSDAQLMDIFVETLGKEDDRMPRMDMGLGVWSDDSQRYYPVDALRTNGSYILDEFAGQSVLVYLDPITSSPQALFVDAESVEVRGKALHLDGNRRIVSGRLFDADGASSVLEKPQQIFTRWYGFALTFTKPEIYQ